MKIVSLKSKLLISTTLACSMIVLLISCLDLIQYRELEKERIDKEFLNFEKGAEQAIREAVWIYDWDMVQTILESQTSQFITFVEVCDKQKSMCLQHGAQGKEPYLDFQTSISYNNIGIDDQIEIGTIYLQSYYETVPSHILHHLPKLLLVNVFSVFGIAGILLYLFNRQVIDRLLVLEHFTRKIDLQKIGSIEVTSVSYKDREKDEIDLLADALGSLIEKTKDELERRQTLEQQLNQNNKMEALGNLAGGIAHDFNNILAAILGYAELSRLKTIPGTKLDSNLNNIIRAGQRACNLTAQILVFSRRTKSPQEVLSFASIVVETLSLVRISLPSNVLIETDLDYEIRVKGDSTQLHQVVMNIATNGVQALGNGGGVLYLTVKAVILDKHDSERLVLQPGAYCCLEISDNGPGISSEMQARVFEPFFTTKSVGKGTGMGLAVVHAIVQNHNGAIVIDSTMGSGTTFSIYIPQTTESLIAIAKIPHIPKGRGQKIVLVDDESQVLNMGVSVLESLGYTVTSFSDPEDAQSYLRENHLIDLVITDLTMPKMSGVELATSLKSLRPDVPIMLWTGYKDDVALKSLRKNLVNRIVQKPFDMENIATEVSETIENARS